MILWAIRLRLSLGYCLAATLRERLRSPNRLTRYPVTERSRSDPDTGCDSRWHLRKKGMAKLTTPFFGIETREN